MRMNPGIGLAVACLLLLDGVRAADLAPSEVTVLINHAMATRPDAPRRTLTEPLIARMVVADRSETELFFKGEAHFLNLEPEPARDAFWELRNRRDDIGRVATQRLMIIRINAFGMVDDLLRKDIPAYRAKHGTRSDDRFGITFPVLRTATALLDQDRGNEALDLVVAEVRAHADFDAPYSAYRLPAQFLAAADQLGRGDEFRQLRQWVIDGVEAALAGRSAPPADSRAEPPALPGVVFRSLYADQGKDYHDWTAEWQRLRDGL